MRSFIAIEFPQDIKKELSALIGTLKDSGADVKWVETVNLHLTLKFLGDVDLERLKQIKKMLDGLCERKESFSLSLSDIGCFPSVRSPRVIWVGIDKGGDELKSLTAELEPELKAIGFRLEERPFHPHLTIGRVRTSKNIDMLKKKIEKTAFSSSHPVVIDRITLFSSELTPKGPIYTPVHTIQFLK